MSTRALIGVEQNNGSVLAIYLHWDGEPRFVLPVLNESYNNKRKADKLIKLGALSSLGNKLEGTKNHSFDSREDDVCTAYHRDRGDDWSYCKPERYSSIKDFIETEESMIEYRYVLEKGSNEWKAYSGTVEVLSALANKRLKRRRKEVKSSLIRRNRIQSANTYDTFIKPYYDTYLSGEYFRENFKILKYSGYRSASISFYIDYGNIEPDSISEYADKAGFVWDDEREAYVKGNKEIYEEDLNDENIEAWEVIANELPGLEIYGTSGYSQGDFAHVIIDMDKLEKSWGINPKLRNVEEEIDHLFWDAPLCFKVVVSGDDNEAMRDALEDKFGGYKYYDKDDVVSYIKERYGREFPEETIDLLIASLPQHAEYK